MPDYDITEVKARMASGELYHAFIPELIEERAHCSRAVNAFNDCRETSRRHRVQLWRKITQNTESLPAELSDPEADAALFDNTDPWVEPPLRADFGYNVHIAPRAFVNFNATFIDTCTISIGARTLLGPNCSLYTGVHPLDPLVRNGTEGPESGKPIVIEEDCWLGGGVTVLPGITIGRGSVVGAASVVTKDVAPFTVVAGNPAKFIRRIETRLDPAQQHR